MKIKNLTPSKFADEIGIQRSSMSHIMGGRNLPSLDLITKILKKYPDINSEWLIQGEGPMLKTIQIDLFEQQTEKLPTEIPTPVMDTQPEMQAINEQKAVQEFEKTVVKAPEIVQPEIKPPEIKEVEPEKSKPTEVEIPPVKKEQSENVPEKPEQPSTKKTDATLEIEKIVIFYKNRTFREYYPEQ
ncbi:MAG TPA: hypothetical protein PKW80_02235 [Bacteroidales bacterium]|nr:hypothetical protein [Bacteroidales bacterium]